MPPKRKNSLTPQTTNTKKVKSKEGAPDASQNENESQPTEAVPTQKRGRGRPRKHPIVDQQKVPADQSTSSLPIGNPLPLSAGSNLAGQGSQVPMTEVSQNKEAPAVVKPRRGRPKKNPVPVESAPKGDLLPPKEVIAKEPEGNDKSAPSALSTGSQQTTQQATQQTTQKTTQQATQQPLIKDAATITDITISNGSQSIDLLLQHTALHTQNIITPVGESTPPPKKRGRPKKIISTPAPVTASQKESVFQPVAIAPAEASTKTSGDPVPVIASPTKGKRGRPRKNPLPEGNEPPKTTKVNKEDSVKSTSGATTGETQPASVEPAQEAVAVVKKGRGRPRKNTVEDKDVNNKSTTAKSLPAEGEKPKSKRGRPKKQISPEESAKLAKPKDPSAPQARRGRPPKRKTPDNVQSDASWVSQAPEKVGTVSSERSVAGGSTVSDKPNVKKPRLDGTGSIEDIIESVKYAPQPESLHEERMKKLENMRNLLSSSSQANREEVFAEHQRKKINHKEEVRREYKKAEAEKLLARQEIERAGGDYERLRSWTYSAEEAEKWEKREEKKAKRKEIGFTDYNQVAEKKYRRQIHELKPDLHAYQEAKAQAGASSVDDTNFYRDANSLAFAGVDSQPSRQAVERLVSDVNKQIEQREKFSRHKPVNEEEDITYINERNRHFNEKIDRYYGKYTKEIRENFERGTAL